MAWELIPLACMSLILLLGPNRKPLRWRLFRGWCGCNACTEKEEEIGCNPKFDDVDLPHVSGSNITVQLVNAEHCFLGPPKHIETLNDEVSWNVGEIEGTICGVLLDGNLPDIIKNALALRATPVLPIIPTMVKEWQSVNFSKILELTA